MKRTTDKAEDRKGGTATKSEKAGKIYQIHASRLGAQMKKSKDDLDSEFFRGASAVLQMLADLSSGHPTDWPKTIHPAFGDARDGIREALAIVQM